jgi:hypothetical protein
MFKNVNFLLLFSWDKHQLCTETVLKKALDPGSATLLKTNTDQQPCKLFKLFFIIARAGCAGDDDLGIINYDYVRSLTVIKKTTRQGCGPYSYSSSYIRITIRHTEHVTHGRNNYIDYNSKFRLFLKLTCKVTLRQVLKNLFLSVDLIDTFSSIVAYLCSVVDYTRWHFSRNFARRRFQGFGMKTSLK